MNFSNIMVKSLMGAMMGSKTMEMTEREEEVCNMLDTKFKKTMFSIAVNCINEDSNKEELQEIWEVLNFSAQLGEFHGIIPTIDGDYEKVSKIIKEINNLLTEETDYVFQSGYLKETGRVFTFPILTKEEFEKQQESLKRISEESKKEITENTENNDSVALNPQFEVFGMGNEETEVENCKKKIKK